MDIPIAIVLAAVLVAVIYAIARSRSPSPHEPAKPSDAINTSDADDPVHAALAREYLDMWATWYSEVDGQTPARLHFELNASCSLYNHEKDQHHITLGEFDVDELMGKTDAAFQRPNDSTDWPKWKQELVHEMLHEYQYKALNRDESNTGKQLFDAHHSKFVGQGHGPDYFTAIERVAPLFDLSPEQLIEQIR